jgi:hypothetical protein
MSRQAKRPVGSATRGKTAANRLRRIDALISLLEEPLLRRSDGEFARARFVDLGYGAEPTTTLETAARLRRIRPDLRVLGVEIDPVRVAAARPFEDERTSFRLGGFNLPLESGESVRLIRAFNVLRQYDEAEVAEAHDLLAAALLPGGLLVEGTSEPHGRHWVAQLLRKLEAGGLRSEALVFGTSFRAGFDPAAFQPVLPKSLIHRVVPGEPVFDFFEDWKRAARDTVGEKSWGARRWFIAAADRLGELGWNVDLRRRLLDRGYLSLRSFDRS